MLSENFAYPKLMRFFEEISEIPRASYQEKAIADYLVAFAKQRDLAWYRDSVNNVLIELPATPDCMDREPILLQGHTDMVCEKNAGVEHDFDKDPLKLYEADGWIRAEGTTLGADNGVAVAVMLALLDGAAESHPSLQCLFTASEEVGLDGAKAFDYGRIVARKMINMDSADESCMIAGCAGGLRSQISLPITREACSLPQLRLRIGGLFGGHSGEDIHKGRANANKVLGRILWELRKVHADLRLIAVEGGSKDNAIPREAEAIFCVGDIDGVRAQISSLDAIIAAELVGDDRGFSLSLEECMSEETLPFNEESTKNVIFLLETVGNGVFSMNPNLPEVVEFSRNLGVLQTEADHVSLIFSSRSALESQIDRSSSELDAYADLLGASVQHYNRYPGWNFAPVSALREAYAAAYGKLFGKEPRIEVIHAGLECGIIKQALPDMDMISCGPIILDLHSPDEALHKKSFERFFSVILEMLKA